MVWNGEWIRTRRAMGYQLSGTHERNRREWLGRYWIRTDDESFTMVASAEVCVRPPHPMIGAGISWGGEDENITVHVNVLGTRVYASVGYGRFPTDREERHAWSADFGHDPDTNEWRTYLHFGPYDHSGTGPDTYKFIHWSDILWGKCVYTEGAPEMHDVLIQMPERSYRWKIALRIDEWKRPRWPWGKRILRMHADCEKGEQIPIPGKGENAWDCDEDALFGSTCRVTGLHDGIAKIVDSATRSRLKYGGQGWKPEGVKPAPEPATSAP